jgi:hypothetical protein
MIPTRIVAAAVLAIGAMSAPAAAQTVTFWYMAPRAQMTNGFGDGPHLGGTYADGYREVEITAARQPAFMKTASDPLKTTFQAMQPRTELRTAMDRILQISGGLVDVDVLLVDDRTGLPGAHTVSDFTVGGNTYVWPAVRYLDSPTPGRYRALLMLGWASHVVIKTQPGGWRAWESTILHESGHTQMVGEASRWASIGIAYGADGSHWEEELLGDQEIPFDEGLGTFWGNVHNAPYYFDAFQKFLNDVDYRYKVESWSVLAGTAELWNAPHRDRSDFDRPAAPPGGRYFVREFKWKDVPGKYLLNSESTTSAFHDFFWRYANGDRNQAFDMVINSAKGMWLDRKHRFIAFAVISLSNQLEDFAATPAGKAKGTAGTLTSSMYPVALMDLVTHFGMDRAEIERQIAAQNPSRRAKALTEYWTHRDQVRKLAEPYLASTPMGIEGAVSAIHKYFVQPNTILTP